MLVRYNTFLLTIKLLAFLLEDLVAYANVLFVGLIIEFAAAVRALIQVHLLGFGSESVSSKVASSRVLF